MGSYTYSSGGISANVYRPDVSSSGSSLLSNIPVVGPALGFLSGMSGYISPDGKTQSQRYNEQLQAVNMAFQHKEAELAYQRQVEQWQREAEYNNPFNQMSRLAAAGLNPNLIYGQMGNSPSASSAPQAGGVSSPYVQPGSSSKDKFMDLFNQLMSIKNFRLQQEKLESDIELQKAERVRLLSEAGSTDFDTQFKRLVLNTRIALEKSNLSFSQKRNILADLEAQYSGEKIKNLTYQNQFDRDTYQDRLSASGLGLALLRANIRSKNASSSSLEYDTKYRLELEDVFKKTDEYKRDILGLEKFLRRETMPADIDKRNKESSILDYELTALEELAALRAFLADDDNLSSYFVKNAGNSYSSKDALTDILKDYKKGYQLIKLLRLR